MLAIGSLLFFLSGLAALLYQVVWQRLLGLFSGADVYAATIVVGAFMGGLGIGSLGGGRIADRLTVRANLAVFAAVELAVGLFGLASAWIYYDVLYLRLGHLAAHTAVMPLILFASLLVPTFFMGMSLPLLARALTQTIDRAARTVGALYGLNAMGASAGALLTTWWLLPRVGLDGSLRISAALNVIIAIAAAALALRMSPARPAPPGVPDRSVRPAAVEHALLPFPFWIAIYVLSGFLALSLELVWFRMIGVIAKSTAFTSGTLLAVYLGGLGLGSLSGSVLARRIRRPDLAFLLIQAGIGLYVGLSVIVLLSNLDVPVLSWLRHHLAQYDPLDLSEAVIEGRITLLLLYVGIPVVLMGPPTILMGLSFPLLQSVTQTDFARLGSRVGALMLANIAGSTLGAILTGWFGLRYLGTAGTLKLAVAASGGFALMGLGLAFRARSPRWMWPLACTISLLIACGLIGSMPAAGRLWAGLHGVAATRVVFGEDETGLSLVKLPSDRLNDRASVFVNGLGQSWIPYEDVHTALGALPALVHPRPRDVAVIGLGSGNTVFGLAGRRDIERIVVIEIARSQLDTLVRFERVYGYPALQRMLRDPRIAHVNGDGRLYAMQVGLQFDIIEADALRPGSAHAGNLYSERYFILLRDRLKPGGLAVTWAPTPRTRRTFVKVFPHVVDYGEILLGSRDAIDANPEAIRARLTPEVIDYYAHADVDIRALVERYISSSPRRFDVGHDRSAIVDINTDLFPRDEFDLPPLSAWGSRQMPTD